uniref:Uncharacterized protein n=1 Tax=Rhodnius prolixus TaxID=13249 RepID=T1H7P1_RHOPR
MVSSVLLYASEIWSPNYFDLLERVHLKFLKSLLHLSRNTPDAFVRLESNRLHIKALIFKRMLGFWSKILNLPHDSLPRVCYNGLSEQSDTIQLPYNWVMEFRRLLFSIGGDDVWLAQSSEELRKRKNSLIESFNNNLLSKDVLSVTHASFNNYFRSISLLGLPEPYIYFRCDPKFIRTLSQIRLMSKIKPRIYLNGTVHSFNPDNVCSLCKCSKDEFAHFLLEYRYEPPAPVQYVDPAMIGVLVGMALMFIIICVVLRLFSKYVANIVLTGKNGIIGSDFLFTEKNQFRLIARWRDNRTIFNTPNPRLMNVSLLRESKPPGERRGSKGSNTRVPSRQPSLASLRPQSPAGQSQE